MEVIHERCCGLDVHKRTVVACIRIQKAEGGAHMDIKTFTTMSFDLLILRDWLTANKVTHVAMESTGVYWKPVFNLLEDQFQVLLVNAHHVKALPGRKTDVRDCEWIADLLAHGLVRGSFIPPEPVRDLRDLTRYRKSLIDERIREVNRLHKLLETANIKLASVATNVMGISGKDMMHALLGGEADPEILAELARGRLRKKIPALKKALEGRFRQHHRFMLENILAHIDFLDESIATVSEEVVSRLDPFAQTVELLCTIPGVEKRTAQVIISEIGTDMSRFPSADHLASWAGLCPGNNESAGKRKTGKTRKGDQWLRRALVEVAWAASRTKGTYLSSQYHRLVARRGKKKAIVAVAHSILVAVYHILVNRAPYQDLGPDYLLKLNETNIKRYHVRRLQELGYQVSITPLEQAA
jgi:transposase